MKSTESTRRLVLVAMLSALSYLVVAVGRIPVTLFLNFDPKDSVIVIGGFLLGPVPALIISAVVSVIQVFTISTTGWIGCLMNILSTWAFVLPAAVLYQKRRTLKSAVLGLAIGVFCMTALMLAWNYIITPMYMGIPRAAVAEMLLPVFLPFNAVKGALNAGIAMLVYKPVSRALCKAHLMPEAKKVETSDSSKKRSLSVTVVSLFVIATAVVCFILLAKQ